MLGDDYKLVAAGADAEDIKGEVQYALVTEFPLTRHGYLFRIRSAGLSNESAEAGIEGWASLDESYAFQYVDTTGMQATQTTRLGCKATVLPLGTF